MSKITKKVLLKENTLIAKFLETFLKSNEINLVYENPMQKHAKDIKFNHGSVILPKIWSSKHSIGWKLASLITYMGLLNGIKGVRTKPEKREPISIIWY